MCGIAGSLTRDRDPRVIDTLCDMGAELRHRGPDGASLFTDGCFGMVNTRLAIIDLAGGTQPLTDESRRYWVMQNGEIYNYIELQEQLRSLGYRFRTSSDTEVIAYAYAEWGLASLDRLNGDFAIAIWDSFERELVLARDRFGARPLYLSLFDDCVLFASEVRALMRHPRVTRQLDTTSLVDAITVWSTLPGRSAFSGITEVPPAHWVRVTADCRVEQRRWWRLPFPSHDAQHGGDEEELAAELETLMDDSVRLRLRADVPVASYLSGGLDSSLVTALASRAGGTVTCFGIGFEDAHFDESSEQDRFASATGARLSRFNFSANDVGDLIPDAIERSERITLRTAHAPLLALSGHVRKNGIKVVLSGEGADELFGGYDIFKEALARRRWADDPYSAEWPTLLRKLYGDLPTRLDRSGKFLESFFGQDLDDVGNPLFTHWIRYRNMQRCLRVLDSAVLADGRRMGTAEERLIALLPPDFADQSVLCRAQQIEIMTFLHGYLLHSQGDRMMMANSVEGRFPFLDYRVAEFAARLRDDLKIRGQTEKYLLRKAFARFLPTSIASRPKRPYRAPISSIFSGGLPDPVRALLATENVRRAGLLNPAVTARLQEKVALRGGSETEEMALMAALSIMVLQDRLVEHPVLARRLEPTFAVTMSADGARVATGDRADRVVGQVGDIR